MRRKITAIICTIIICTLWIANGIMYKHAYAATLQRNKLVYVVVDDSASMRTQNRWTQAQYALQILAGILNPEDGLKLYYLNDYLRDENKKKKWSVPLSAGEIQGSMQNIVDRLGRVNTDYRGDMEDLTPYDEVEEAYKSLVEESQHAEYDNYWLVIMTDGAFNKGTFKKKEWHEKKLRARFEEFVDKRIGPNEDQRLRMIYCTIGTASESFVIQKKAEDPIELESKGIYCYNAANNQIIPVMGTIADKVAERTRFTGDDLTLSNDGKTIHFHTDIPLLNMVVVAQGNEAQLKEPDGLIATRKANVVEPEITDEKAIFQEKLNGSVCTIENRDYPGGNIPAGDYDLTFDKEITTDQITVIVEPAVEIKLKHYKFGNLLNGDPSALIHVGQQYGISGDILEYGSTGEYISLSKLPKGTKLILNLENGVQRQSIEIDESNENRDQEYIKLDSVTDDRISIEGILKIPGFTDISIYQEFFPLSEPEEPGIRVVDITSSSGGKNKLTVYTEEIIKREKYLDFKLQFVGDEPTDYKDTVCFNTDLPYSLEYLDNNVIRFFPKYSDAVALGKEYTVQLFDKDKKTTAIAEAKIIVLQSSYALEADQSNIAATQEELRQADKTVTFTLKVDGQEANANEYTDRLKIAA